MRIITDSTCALVVSYITKKSNKTNYFLDIEDILIIGKVGYGIVESEDAALNSSLGDHGYDNRDESMHPIFYAFGPAFRSELLAEPFRNVDLYPLMSHILHLDQRTTNGSLDNVKHILNDFPLNDLTRYTGE